MSKYDYENADFCNRLRLRKSIMSKNAIVSRIAGSIGYNYNAAHTLIMECFYGYNNNDNVIRKYDKDLTPIDFFEAKTLEYFSVFLSSIIAKWPEKKFNSSNTKTAFEQLVKVEAEIVRELCRQNGSLPEHNDKAERLPKITEAIIKKADETLKKSNIQTTGAAYAVLHSKKKKPKITDLTKKEKLIVQETVERTVKELIKQNPNAQNIIINEEKEPEINLFNYHLHLPEYKEHKNAMSYITRRQNKIKQEKVNIYDSKSKIETLSKEKTKLEEVADTAKYEIKATRPNLESFAEYAKLKQCNEKILVIDTEINNLQQIIKTSEKNIEKFNNEINAKVEVIEQANSNVMIKK